MCWYSNANCDVQVKLINEGFHTGIGQPVVKKTGRDEYIIQNPNHWFNLVKQKRVGLLQLFEYWGG